MAIGPGSQIEVVVNNTGLNGQVINAWQYEVATFPTPVTVEEFLAAWWNHVKAVYRGIYPVAYGSVFRTLRMRELNNPVGEYGEYDIPVGERVGTRTNPTQAELSPPFEAAGVRLTVSTRATRPGQKRFSCLVEGDNISGVLQGTAITSVNAMMALMTAPMTLGAPAALTVIRPIVCRKDGAGNVAAHQPVTGWLLNQYITTQNSRKYGRGA